MTHGVVTPNIEAAISGRLSPSSSGAACTMPAIAAAAFARMRAETELMPATSTTEAASSMSLAPTIGRVSPAAIVETISFGTPTGSARMASAAIEVLPEPPAASTPSQRPSAYRRRDDRGRAARHREHGLAAVARGAQRLDVGAGGRRDLLAASRRARPAAGP